MESAAPTPSVAPPVTAASPAAMLAVPFPARGREWYATLRALDAETRERVLEGVDARRDDPAAFEDPVDARPA